jgi:hypothetical protein
VEPSLAARKKNDGEKKRLRERESRRSTGCKAEVSAAGASMNTAAKQKPQHRWSQRRRADRAELKLAECLEQLSECDPRRVLRVSGMGRRGADPPVVQEYFESRYGEVESFLLANPLTSNNIMGFLVMRNALDATRALGDGPVKEVVSGGSVQVRAFERRPRQAPVSAVDGFGQL